MAEVPWSEGDSDVQYWQLATLETTGRQTSWGSFVRAQLDTL